MNFAETPIQSIHYKNQVFKSGQADIAMATGLSLPTIKRAESERKVSVSDDAVDAIRAALEAAGVEFTNGKQPGVRLQRAKP